MIPLLSALVALLLASIAEWLHVRRIRRVALLAFGPSGASRPWTRAVPLLRALSIAAFAWGLTTLWVLKIEADRPANRDKQAAEATRLIFVADLSPSMYLQ